MFECPFCCGFETSDLYQIQLHVEVQHIAGSGFATKDDESFSLALQLQLEEEDALRSQSLDGTSHSFALSLQRETAHTDLAVPSGENGNDDEIPYFECPRPGCGEFVHLCEINEHFDLHASTDPSLDAGSTSAITNTMIDSDSGYDTDPHRSLLKDGAYHDTSTLEIKSHKTFQENSGKGNKIGRTIAPFLLDRSLKKNTSRSSAKKTEKSGRLGKNELGPYAHEDRMPQWLYDDLKRGGPVRQVNRIGGDGKLYRESFVENEVKHTVTALSVLSNISDTVVRAYFCHSEVQHVFKRKYEGGFCGYRNIQMLFSYLQAVKDQKWEHSATRVPGVLEIQDIIEDAWDHGVDDLGRIQTGGVKGTRKWIGTPEALTVFRHLDVPCRIESYSTTEEAPAYESILNHIEAYFDSGYFNAGNKVCSTKLPPIYLQQPGHSLTIVGLERHKNGSRYLLVLDPSFGPSHGVQQLAMTKKLPSSWNDSTAQKLLKPYRRGRTQLSKYAEFETLEIVASSSLSST